LSDALTAQDGESWASIINFRDFGGCTTVDGLSIARGRLYRSGQLALINDAEQQRLQALDLGLIVDLRTAHERRKSPSRLHQDYAGQRLENKAEDNGPAPHLAVTSAKMTAPEVRAMLCAGYGKFLFTPHVTEVLRAYFARLGQLEGAVLLHCTAGKDRTGMAAALTLLLLGVHQDDVIADYMRSTSATEALRLSEGAQYIRQRYGQSLSDEAFDAFMGVHPSYLESGLEALRARHGTIAKYLRDELGVDDSAREQIRKGLAA
jgi:protein tyrosine/serine phosphatase